MNPDTAKVLYSEAVAHQSHRPYLAFSIPGPPVGKQRYAPRRKLGPHDVIGPPPRKRKAGRTPDKTREYENHIRACGETAKNKLRHNWWTDPRPWNDPVHWPTDKEVYCDIWIYHGKGPWPDGDNVGKAILDGLQGLVWHNDNRVLLRQQGRVVRCDSPRVDVLVSFVEG